MDDFPSLQVASGRGASQPTPDGLSSAERLMRQHHQHLSYEEMRVVNEQQVQTNGGSHLNQQSDHKKINGSVAAQPGSRTGNSQKQQPDMDSETAFPSLGSAAPAPKTAVGWGQGPALSSRLVGGLQRPGSTNTNQYTETLVLLLSSIHIGAVPSQFREKGPRAAGEKREEDPKTLPDVLRAIQKRHPTVSLESSTSRDRVTILFRTPYILPPLTSSTPALVKVAHALNPEERIIRARQELIARVTRKIDKVILVPASVKPFVIGQKGRVLKEIIESTGASITLPPKIDTHPTSAPVTTPEGENEQDVEMIPITLSGEESSVLGAEDRIMAIVKERTNKITLKIDSIPSELFPLLDGPASKGSRLSQLVTSNLVSQLGIKEEDVTCHLNIPSFERFSNATGSHLCLADHDVPDRGENSSHVDQAMKTKASIITISGDKEQVDLAVKVIESAYEQLKKTVNKVEVEIPKRQHRFLDTAAIQEILEATGSLVTLPPLSDRSEKVVIRGENMSNVQALGLVVTKANANKIEVLDLKAVHPTLSDPQLYVTQIITFLSTKAYQTKLKLIQDEAFKKGIKIYLPLPCSPSTAIEIVGSDADSLKPVKDAILSCLKTMMKPSYFETLEVDKLLRSYILRKKSPRLKSLMEPKGVEIIIPSEADPSSIIILAAIKPIFGKDPKPVDSEITQALNRVKEEILKSLKVLANMQTCQVEVPQKYHAHIVGPNGTTLNAIIGEDKLVSIETGQGDSKDLFIIHGTTDEVERVEKEIKRMAEEAKITETCNSHSTEFEVDSKLVSHLVGKGGSTVSKLRELLGVRIDFSDLPTEEGVGGGHSVKKRKQKALVVIVGRKENVEEAKKRILGQAERLADEVTISLPMLAGLDKGALVGKGGKYIQRLQDTHMVFINMPRGLNSENGVNSNDTDKIIIRGPKKGVEAVRKELVDLMEYERENSNTISMNIPTKSIARIVGRGGANADKIKEDSGIFSMDIDNLGGDGEHLSRVTLKGTKVSISAAKKMINHIVQEVDEAGVAQVKIEKVYHQALIGRTGARIRELVKMAGGDDEAARQVHFPKSSDSSETSEIVVIKGHKNLVPKIQRKLEEEVERLRNRVTLGVFIPKASHPSVIGRGASGLKTVQQVHNVTIYVPGWKEWSSADSPINQPELTDCNPDEIFKVVGTQESCLEAIGALKSKAATRDRVERSKVVKKTVMVPWKCHHRLFDNGRFIRELPRGVRLDHGNINVPSPYGNNNIVKVDPIAPTTRIDVDSEEDHQSVVISWDAQEIDNSEHEYKEIPWNLLGSDIDEIEKTEQVIKERLQIIQGEKEQKKKHMMIVKVPSESIAKIIGRGGIGIKNLKEQSGCEHIEVLGGKVGADSFKFVGDLDQFEKIRTILNSRF